MQSQQQWRDNTGPHYFVRQSFFPPCPALPSPLPPTPPHPIPPHFDSLSLSLHRPHSQSFSLGHWIFTWSSRLTHLEAQVCVKSLRRWDLSRRRWGCVGIGLFSKPRERKFWKSSTAKNRHGPSWGSGSFRNRHRTELDHRAASSCPLYG